MLADRTLVAAAVSSAQAAIRDDPAQREACSMTSRRSPRAAVTSGAGAERISSRAAAERANSAPPTAMTVRRAFILTILHDRQLFCTLCYNCLLLINFHKSVSGAVPFDTRRTIDVAPIQRGGDGKVPPAAMKNSCIAPSNFAFAPLGHRIGESQAEIGARYNGIAGWPA